MGSQEFCAVHTRNPKGGFKLITYSTNADKLNDSNQMKNICWDNMKNFHCTSPVKPKGSKLKLRQ